jgi:hypothetical protein
METVFRNNLVSRNQSLCGNVFAHSFPRNGPHVTITYIIKLCRTQAEVILNHRNPIVRGTGQGEAMNRKYKRLKLGGGQACEYSAD